MVAFALMGSPGPASLSLAATGAAYDVGPSRRYLLGLNIGAMIVIMCVAAGIFAAITTIPYATEVLGVIAIAYLGFLAFKIATAPPIGEDTVSSKGPGFLNGFFLNLSNPKAYAAFTALSSSQSTYLQIFICFVVLWIVNPAWLYAGSALRRILRDETTSRRVNIGFAMLLVASVILVVFL